MLVVMIAIQKSKEKRMIKGKLKEKIKSAPKSLSAVAWMTERNTCGASSGRLPSAGRQTIAEATEPRIPPPVGPIRPGVGWSIC